MADATALDPAIEEWLLDILGTHSLETYKVQAGYWRIEQRTELSEAEVAQLHGVGPKALDQLRRPLGAHGLSFADRKR